MDAALGHQPAHDQAADGWEQRLRAVIRDVRRAEPRDRARREELFMARVREIVAERACEFEMDARRRADAAYAAGVADCRAGCRHLAVVRD